MDRRERVVNRRGDAENPDPTLVLFFVSFDREVREHAATDPTEQDVVSVGVGWVEGPKQHSADNELGNPNRFHGAARNRQGREAFRPPSYPNIGPSGRRTLPWRREGSADSQCTRASCSDEDGRTAFRLRKLNARREKSDPKCRLSTGAASPIMRSLGQTSLLPAGITEEPNHE